MSRSVVRIGRRWFECNDTLLSLWAAIAVEEILTAPSPSDFLMDLGEQLERCVGMGAMFSVFGRIDIGDMRKAADVIWLNRKVRDRLISFNGQISKEQANSYKIGGVTFGPDVSTEVIMKVVRTLDDMLTGTSDSGEIFEIQDCPKSNEIG